MQAIDGFAAHVRPRDDSAPGSSMENLSAVLRAALRGLLDGGYDLPQSVAEGAAAALILLPAKGEPVRVLDANGPDGPPLPFQVVHHRGDQLFFPGELVSLFFLAGAYLQIRSGDLAQDANVERDILRMIRAEDIDAANLIFDRITGTLSGPELADANLEIFARRRGRLDELMGWIGIRGVRCRQKIWDRPPYGRDAQFLGPDRSQDNQVSAAAAAVLLAKILLGQVGGPEACEQILNLLRFDPHEAAAPASGRNSRLHMAERLPSGSRTWGRHASGSRILHEILAAELPGGTRFAVAFCSYLGAKRASLLPSFGEAVAEGVARLAG